ncbi:hypothetical protein DY000_02040915 [Brassica cretica]|uniref:Uncharacterized protein n=1 Tax=Brassica cretica TaxID=69181 RepID=A0ABQ7BL74_BRACR|nr:hypothetical protein DY000_02040915 [Brassica cretica]
MILPASIMVCNVTSRPTREDLLTEKVEGRVLARSDRSSRPGLGRSSISDVSGSRWYTARSFWVLANFGHFVLSFEVGDFSARGLCVWAVVNDTGGGVVSSGFFQCADCYRDLQANFSFGLALDFVGCVVVWPPRNHVDYFLRSWGGELGDSCSISLPLLFTGALGGSTPLLTDRVAFDFFLECLQLDALRVPSQPGLVEGSAKLVWIEIGSGHLWIVCPRDVAIGGFRCVWVVPVASLAPINLVGVTLVPESDPMGSMSLTLEGVVPGGLGGIHSHA